MGRKAGRSPEDTRRDLLDAAAVVLVQKGRSTSLADIARQADVTKGGLLYHFGSREDLLAAVAEDLLQSYEKLLQSMIDPDDDAPGRFCRAYVRASFVTWSPVEIGFLNPLVMAIVLDEPRTVEIVDRFTVDLHGRLHGDGLPHDVVDLVVAAADGASMRPLWWAGIEPEPYGTLQERLIALTHLP